MRLPAHRRQSLACISLSALGGGEGQGEVGDVIRGGFYRAGKPQQPHLTPALSAPRGGEGVKPEQDGCGQVSDR
jgi:hypothetical protein